MQYIVFEAKYKNLQRPIALCWYDETTKTHGENWLLEYFLSPEEEKLVQNLKFTIKEWISTKILPYSYEVLEPWTPQFWDELIKILEPTQFRVIKLESSNK